MNESKGWVHWHPDGYALDSNDVRARSLDKACVWSDLDEATEWDSEASKECEVIPLEEAVQRLAQAVMKGTAEELRKEREAAPKPIANPNMAPKAGIAKPADDRMMVRFMVDPSKYRVGIRKVGDVYNVNVTDREDGATIYCRTGALPSNEALFEAITYSVAGNAGKLLPHPWKRADGSRIKASWEENEEFWANIRKSADMAKDQPAWTSAGIKVSKNFSGGE